MTGKAKDRHPRQDPRTIRVILARVHFVAGLGFLAYGEGLGVQHIFDNPLAWGWANILLGVAMWWAGFPPTITVLVKMLSLLMMLTLTYAYLGSGVMTALIYAALGWSAVEGIYLAGYDLYRRQQ